jgi:hypothetical protein
MRYYAIQLNWKVRTRHPLVKEFTERTGLSYHKLRSWVQNNKPRHLKRTPQPGRIGSGNARTRKRYDDGEEHDRDRDHYEDEELQYAVNHRMPQIHGQQEQMIDSQQHMHMHIGSSLHMPQAADHAVAIQQLPLPPGFLPVPPFNPSDIQLQLPSLPPPFPLAHQHYGDDTHHSTDLDVTHDNDNDDDDVIEIDSGSEDISYSESDYSSDDDDNDDDGGGSIASLTTTS